MLENDPTSKAHREEYNYLQNMHIETVSEGNYLPSPIYKAKNLSCNKGRCNKASVKLQLTRLIYQTVSEVDRTDNFIQQEILLTAT